MYNQKFCTLIFLEGRFLMIACKLKRDNSCCLTEVIDLVYCRHCPKFLSEGLNLVFHHGAHTKR